MKPLSSRVYSSVIFSGWAEKIKFLSCWQLERAILSNTVVFNLKQLVLACVLCHGACRTERPCPTRSVQPSVCTAHSQTPTHKLTWEVVVCCAVFEKGRRLDLISLLQWKQGGEHLKACNWPNGGSTVGGMQHLGGAFFFFCMVAASDSFFLCNRSPAKL